MVEDIRASLRRKYREPMLDMSPRQMEQMRKEFRTRRRLLLRGPRLKATVLQNYPNAPTPSRSIRNITQFIANREVNANRPPNVNTVDDMKQDLYIESNLCDYTKEHHQTWRRDKKEKLYMYADRKMELAGRAQEWKDSLERDAALMKEKSRLARSNYEEMSKCRSQAEQKLRYAKREGEKVTRIRQAAHTDWKYAEYISRFSSSDDDY